MNIAFFSDVYKPYVSGVVNAVNLFARELRARGHRVYIFAPSTNRKPEPDFYRLPALSLPFYPDLLLGLPLSARIHKAMHTLPIDLVHCHTPASAGMIGLALAKERKVPCLLTYHTMLGDYAEHYLPRSLTPIVKLVGQYDRFFCNGFQCIVAPAESTADHLRRLKLTSPIEVIHNGIDLAPFQTISLSPKLRLLRERHPKIVGVLARIAPEKNLDFILKVFARLAELDDDLHFLVAGGGPSLKSLIAQSVRDKIRNRITFSDHLLPAEVPAYLSIMDVFTYACRTDVQPLVILEALACGCPIVTSDVPTFKQLIEHGTNGYRLQEDTAIFAGHIHNLLRDDNLRRQFSAASRKAAENYTISAQTGKLTRLYARLLNQFPQQKQKN